MKLLFIGDAFAAPGRRIIETQVPRLREQLGLEFVVANGENLADGVGITSRVARRILDAGVDAITLGNHALRHAEVYPLLDSEPRIVRPANLSARAPGRGLTVCTSASGARMAVVNLMGSLFLEPAASPFAVAEQLVAEARAQAAGGGGRLPRRGDQREGGHGPAAGRLGDAGGRHPHARADQRRPHPGRAAPPTSPTPA